MATNSNLGVLMAKAGQFADIGIPKNLSGSNKHQYNLQRKHPNQQEVASIEMRQLQIPSIEYGCKSHTFGVPNG